MQQDTWVKLIDSRGKDAHAVILPYVFSVLGVFAFIIWGGEALEPGAVQLAVAAWVVLGSLWTLLWFDGVIADLSAAMKDMDQEMASSNVGQNFAKACSIKFSDKDGKLNYAWTTSWGVSTRLIGGLIMTHSDDDGLVLPPRLSPIQVIIIPIHRNSQEQKDVLEYCEILVKEISKVKYFNKCIKVEIDNREIRGGEKKWIHVKRGTPIRLEIGPREVAAKKIVMYKRNEPPTEKHFVDRNEFTSSLSNLLEKIQNSLFDKAKDYLDQNTTKIQNISQFEDYFSNEAKSGFAVLDLVRGTENSSDFKILQKKLKVTPRCIINKSKYPMGTCAITGEKATSQVLFARSY